MKIPKPLIFVLCMLFVSVVWADHETNAPMVSDISYVQRVDGNGSNYYVLDQTMFVEFFFSSDGGVTFPVVLGDAGAGVEPGSSLILMVFQ